MVAMRTNLGIRVILFIHKCIQYINRSNVTVITYSTPRFYRCTKCNYPMCGEECENGELHSKNECLVFQQAGYKVDTKEANDAVGKLIGEKEKGNGEIFKDVKSYRSHIESGGFSPYCFISTIRCIMMKGIS